MIWPKILTATFFVKFPLPIFLMCHESIKNVFVIWRYFERVETFIIASNKFFGPKTIFGPENISDPKKILGPKNIVGPKKLWPRTNFWPTQILSPKKILGPK